MVAVQAATRHNKVLMQQLSQAGQQVIAGMAQRHGFSVDAVMHMLDGVVRGNGSMAQFNRGEFSGSGQWMRGGMTMVSVSLQAVTFDLSCCHRPSELIAGFSELALRACTHMMFEGHEGSTGWFAPFIWHNLAFDPFNLAPSAQQSEGLPRWVISTRFLTP